MSKSNLVRTRYAPSPTGFTHVGGIRTALFAWLFARHNGGQFILRIEDTDQKREVEGSETHVIDSLRSLGIDHDEGPDVGGKYGPYRQSERLDSYIEWANKLINTGRAYADPYTPAELQTFRDEAVSKKQPFLFRNHRPENPPKWDGLTPLRLKSEPKAYTWHDEVLGDISTGPEVIDDIILIKSDGFPTYNFAHIVDDELMAITHIIRSQEYTASVPNYLNIYEALGITPPILATPPPILGADGNKKLGKRDGAKDILDYVRDGYLPEALINFISSLGWNDGTDQEIFTVDELIAKFSLDRIQKGGAQFDEDRLRWMNGTYIRGLTADDIYTRCQAYWPEAAKDYGDDYKRQVLALAQERLKYLSELPELTSFFFEDLSLDRELITKNKQLSKLDVGELRSLLEQSLASIEQSDFSAEDLTDRLNRLLETTGQKPAVLFSLIRIATTAAPFSPPLAETIAVLGQKRSIARINSTLELLATLS